MPDEAVAVVGMGIVVPGASSPAAFWELLNAGRNMLTYPPAERWRVDDFSGDGPDKTYQQAGGFVTGTTPDAQTDLATTWLRHCLTQALAGVSRSPGDRFSLGLGYTADGSLHQEEALVRDEVLAIAEDPAFGLDLLSATALRKALDTHYGRAGASQRYLPHRVARAATDGILPDSTRIHLVDTACSSSLYAVDLGARELAMGDCDIAVCGGALVVTPTSTVLFARNGGLARQPAVRALDADANGVLFADGAGIVVLKRLDRARADGDVVYGLVVGAGLSADGKGKAIYAPSAEGQRRAIARALDRSGVDPTAVGLVVAHATGTPAGDVAELQALRDSYAGCSVVSNKSLVGHTGWAAGVVSLIHLLLAMQHGSIPAQPGFRRAPTALDDRITIPRAAQRWEPTGRPRAGGVSGFGFGGTNAHLLVQDGPGDASSGYRTSDADPLVITGWAAVGAEQPAPDLATLPLPGRTVRRIDRAQLMLVECMARFDPALREVCGRLNDRVGVVVGHCGPTRNALLLRLRAHLDEIERVVPARSVTARLREQVAQLVPEPTEDSYPGEMPNVVAGRLANSFDLRGLSVTVDQGEASLLEAFAAAGHYLRFGDLDLALVGAASGNSLASFQAMLGRGPVREGAFLFALTTSSLAEREGLPVLAEVEEVGAVEATDAGDPGDLGDPGSGTYAGAEGGPELTAFLEGDATTVAVERRADPTGPALRLALRRAAAAGLDRYVLSLAPFPRREPDGPGAELFPPSTLLVTNVTGLAPDDDVPVVEVTDDLDEAAVEAAVRRAQPGHLRVVVAMDGPAVRRVHDALFLAVRAWGPSAGAAGSAAVVLLGGVGIDGVPHPLTGLFTGFVKVLVHEHPAPRVLAVVHDAALLAGASADVRRELDGDQDLPVVYYVGGERRTVRAERRPVREPGPIPLTRESVVLAAGGARGIGAEVLKALARDVAPRIFVLGTTSLDPETDDEDRLVGAGKAAFIDAQRARLTVPEASRAYERLVRRHEARANVAELIRHCGSSRVTYLRCDLAERGVAIGAVRHALAVAGRVDLLLNVAGISRTRTIAQKALDDFRAVRDLKVDAYGNLRAAFAERRPAIWCNVGSYAGFFGVPGESDHAAAHDFLATAAAHSAGREGHDEYTIGFTLWEEAGLAATGLWRSRMDRVALFTPMSSAEGIRHFMVELAHRATSTVQMGSNERRVIRRATPGYLAERTDPPAPAPVEPAGFFVDRVVEQTDDSMVVERRFDLDRDGYLLDHVVGGHPTLPASFYPELAAQVVARLCPGRVAVAFEDLRLESFLRVYGPDRPHTVLIVAQRRTFDAVHVQVLHDVVAPNGRVLVRDRVHARLDVRLGDRPRRAPKWASWSETDSDAALVNPLYLDTPAVRLAGPFRPTSDERQAPGGQRAWFRPDPAGLDRWIARTLTPLLTTEAAVQMFGVQPADGRVAVAVPRRIGRIELFEAGPATELYCVPRDAARLAAGDQPDDRGSAVAVSAENLVVVRVTGMHVIVVDHLSQEASPDPP